MDTTGLPRPGSGVYNAGDLVPNMPAGSVNGFVINTDNLDKEIEELTAKGITVGKIDQTPWGKFAAVTDPDGNRFSLHQA